MPDNLSQGAIDEARQFLPVVTSAAAPADQGLSKAWLIALGTLCAGNMTVQDARLKIAAFAPLMDYPAAVYTRETLTRAGRKFQWFPSFHEITDFLEAEAMGVRNLRDRVRIIAESQARTPESEKPQRYADLSPEEQAAHDELMDGYFARNGGRPNRGGLQKVDTFIPQPVKASVVRQKSQALEDMEREAAEKAQPINPQMAG